MREHLYKCPDCGETRWSVSDPKPFCEHPERVYRTIASRAAGPARRAQVKRGSLSVEIAGRPETETR